MLEAFSYLSSVACGCYLSTYPFMRSTVLARHWMGSDWCLADFQLPISYKCRRHGGQPERHSDASAGEFNECERACEACQKACQRLALEMKGERRSRIVFLVLHRFSSVVKGHRLQFAPFVPCSEMYRGC